MFVTAVKSTIEMVTVMLNQPTNASLVTDKYSLYYYNIQLFPSRRKMEKQFKVPSAKIYSSSDTTKEFNES